MTAEEPHAVLSVEDLPDAVLFLLVVCVNVKVINLEQRVRLRVDETVSGQKGREAVVLIDLLDDIVQPNALHTLGRLCREDRLADHVVQPHKVARADR